MHTRRRRPDYLQACPTGPPVDGVKSALTPALWPCAALYLLQWPASTVLSLYTYGVLYCYRYYRKTLPPDVFKFGPLPNAHISCSTCALLHFSVYFTHYPAIYVKMSTYFTISPHINKRTSVCLLSTSGFRLGDGLSSQKTPQSWILSHVFMFPFSPYVRSEKKCRRQSLRQCGFWNFQSWPLVAFTGLRLKKFCQDTSDNLWPF